MSAETLPDKLRPERMASAHAVLQGNIALEKFTRLCSFLVDQHGSIGVKLGFSRDDKRRVLIDGELSGQVSMACQRCLEPVAVALHTDVALTLVADEALAGRVPEGREPLVIDVEMPVSLAGLLEDDLILALPAAARHPESECRQPGPVTGVESGVEPGEERENPFAVLQTLRGKPEQES